MYADVEALVLSGDFFNGRSGTSSPSRSPSPDQDPGWHDEELEFSTEAQKRRERGLDYDSDEERRDAMKMKEAQSESVGMGPGRTGVKGVIRDRNEVAGKAREKKAREMEEVRKIMEASNLGGKTYLEEEREKAARGEERVDELILRESSKAMEDRRDVFGHARDGKFGHLREVGSKGFLSAVEQEEKNVWIALHIYEPSLERCYLLDDKLAQLARTYPDTRFLRARASTLGFACKNSSSSTKSGIPTRVSSMNRDEDDPYGETEEDHDEEEENEGAIDEDDVDLDMLPTMLVYRGGELIFNWVRVDWEAGRADIEDLLIKHHIVQQISILGGRNLGLPSDDESDDFDLIWSDEDD